MSSPLAELLSSVHAVFERTSTKWYIFSAQAAIVHGASRLTADVDITVMYGDDSIETLISILKEKGFAIRVEDAVSFVENSRVLPVLYLGLGFR